YSVPRGAYRIIDNDRFLLGARGLLPRRECYTDEYLAIDDFEDGATFLDINSAWHTLPNRSYLLPQLRNKQIRILVQIYDLIPIRFPQYMVGQTLLRFMEFLTAHLTYADAVLVNTHAVEADVKALFAELHLPEKPIHIVPLGADFTAPADAKKDGAADAEILRKLAGRKFLLTVGTIEPRKNHKVLIEAYEKRLADMGYSVVIVGRVGWEMEGLVSRIKSNRNYGNGLYLLSGVNDATLDALYAQAHMVVFASYTEGYGLPTIESLIKGVPVLCSDIPVMREVGGAFAEYFDPDDPDALIAAVERLDSDAAYQAKRDAIRTQYHPPQWNETARVMESLICQPETGTPYPHKPVKQVVFLSARPAPILATLPYLEAFMPFITELVVCCPEKMASFLQKHYTGRLKLTTITDDELLGGRQLPPDHSTRNFFLRCLAMEQSAIDDEFIMCDDDYRPLCPLTEEVFYKDGKYRGYYFSDIAKWKFHITALFSYDFCHFRTLHFLRSHGYPSLQYSSHQPQLINKVWYREMLAKYPDISVKGYDEWSTYFNYCAVEHAAQYEPLPYVTLSWPPVGGDNKGVFQPEYLFENFYEENYDAGRPFAGFSRSFTDAAGILRENEQKNVIAIRSKVISEEDKAFAQRFCADYEAAHHVQSQCAVYFGGEEDVMPELGVPETIRLSRSRKNHIPVGVSRAAGSAANILPILVEMHVTDEDVTVLYRETFTIAAQLEYTTLTITLPDDLPDDKPLFLRFAVKLAPRPQRTEKVMAIELTE
ncbi:MAG: glycosyltransferase family 4 protein, partial [Oscillospiraceae bacterium]|nr:glycosyltransferase family 4 protein [Oscillospiraceae bacterium]